MPKQEAPLDYLTRFMPSAAAVRIFEYLHKYKVHLTITQERRSVLGDYRHKTFLKAHRISINGNMNSYAFLITLIHELAHLVTFTEHGNRVQAHGKEWKMLYAFLLKDFIGQEIFPSDIEHYLKQSIPNLPASSCSDDHLTRLLKKYDAQHNGLLWVEQISEGNLFEEQGRIFKKGKKLRKRYQCTEIKTGKVYLFSPVYEVKAV